MYNPFWNIDTPVIQAKLFTNGISSSGAIHLADLYVDSLTVQISSRSDLEIDEGEVGH